MIPAIFDYSSGWPGATVAAGPSCWRTSGKLYFEVEVLETRGDVNVGLAGSNFRADFIGKDDTAWGIRKSGNMDFRLVSFSVNVNSTTNSYYFFQWKGFE